MRSGLFLAIDFPAGRSGDALESLRHLVIIVPGMGGSVLEDTDGRLVWGHSRGSIPRALLSPGILSQSERPRLRPVGLIDSYTVLPPLVIHGYDRTVSQIRRWFPAARVDVDRSDREPDRSADVVLFPYDFRLGVLDAAERLKAAVDRRLGGLSRTERRRRVIVVAHSLGGLVARYWLGSLGGADDCQALVTLGTPHRGMPKMLDWLINGARAGPVVLQDVTEVLRGWPSLYDLLPRYPAIWDENTACAVYPHRAAELGREFCRSAAASYALHRKIEHDWSALPASRRPDVLALFSRGHATISAARLADGKLKFGKEDPGWLPNIGWQGDGSVPAIAAIPVELDDDRRSWQAVTERHGPMGSTLAVADVLRTYSGASLRPVRGATPNSPWLGTAIDDCIPVGMALRVSARLYGTAPDVGCDLWLAIRPADSADPVTSLRMPRSADGWEATVDGFAPGCYQVTVESADRPEIPPVTELVSVAA